MWMLILFKLNHKSQCPLKLGKPYCLDWGDAAEQLLASPFLSRLSQAPDNCQTP